jgi:DNA-binding NarL/FixJ family response regulator
MKKHTTPQKSIKAIKIVIATGDPNLQPELKEKLQSDPSLIVIGNASTGVEALIRCGKEIPHLILMDFKMPECVTGAQMIKAAFPTVRILITGVSSDEELKTALQSGAEGYLRRPVETKELIDTVKNVILGLSVNNDFLYIP